MVFYKEVFSVEPDEIIPYVKYDFRRSYFKDGSTHTVKSNTLFTRHNVSLIKISFYNNAPEDISEINKLWN